VKGPIRISGDDWFLRVYDCIFGNFCLEKWCFQKCRILTKSDKNITLNVRVTSDTASGKDACIPSPSLWIGHCLFHTVNAV